MKKNLLLFLLTIVCLTACGKSEEGKNSSSETPSGENASQASDSPQSPEDASEEASSPQDAPSDASSDTASADNVNKYELSIPDDFSAMDISGMEFYYVNEDGSSISMNVQSKDADFGSLTADELRQALSAAISETYDEEVTITDRYFTANPVNGYPAYQYSFSYTLQETEVNQLIVGIDGDQTYTFTFTDLSGSWMSTFEVSAGSIRLISE